MNPSNNNSSIAEESWLWKILVAIMGWSFFTSFAFPFLMGIAVFHTWTTRQNVQTWGPEGFILFILALCAVWEIARLANLVLVHDRCVPTATTAPRHDPLKDLKNLLEFNPLVDHPWSEEAHTLLLQADMIAGRAYLKEITPLEIMIAAYCGDHAGTKMMEERGVDVVSVREDLLARYASKYTHYRHYNIYKGTSTVPTQAKPAPTILTPQAQANGFRVVEEK